MTICRHCEDKDALIDALTKQTLDYEKVIDRLRGQLVEEKEEVEAIHAQVKKIVDSREAALDQVERLRVDLGEMKLVLESQDLRLKKFHAEILQLREENMTLKGANKRLMALVREERR